MVIRLVIETLDEWQHDNASRQGAALAFYGLFACAPLLLLATAILGAVFGEQTARDELSAQLAVLTTDEVAHTVLRLVELSARSQTDFRASVIGALTLLFGAFRGLLHLQATLNLIWGVRANRRGSFLVVAQRHLVAFGSMLFTGVLLLTSIAVSMVLRSIALSAAGALPRHWVWLRLTEDLSTGLLGMTFIAIVFKTLSDARLQWRDALVGAAVSAGLLVLGKHVMAWYLREIVQASAFGATGAVIGVLIYAYYMAQVVLFGAEFAFVLARNVGDPIEPGPNAVRVRRLFEGIEA
ncbi:MAG: YihY/virulence factor BrkB family protein [Myxococcota bacterium]